MNKLGSTRETDHDYEPEHIGPQQKKRWRAQIGKAEPELTAEQFDVGHTLWQWQLEKDRAFP